jgi:head-tail adaptor
MAYREPAAGDLNRRVAIRLRTDIPADDMGVSSEFSEIKPRWAKIEPVGTGVYSAGVQTGNKVTHRIWIRSLPGVTEAHEVVHVTHLPGEPVYSVVEGAPIYRIKRNADLNGGRRFTLLEVEELGADQAGLNIYGE